MSDEHNPQAKPKDDVKPADELSAEDLLEISAGTTPTISDINNEEAQASAVSNVMKTHHEGAKNTISNIR